jgi:hypothetical protein
MLLVKTKLGLSAIHGIGLFSEQLIPKGTPVLNIMSGFDYHTFDPGDPALKLSLNSL